MKRQILSLVFILFAWPLVSASSPSERRDSIPVNDGPYISFLNDTLEILRIENSQLRKKYILPEDRSKIMLSRNHSTDYAELMKLFTAKPDFRQTFKRVDSIAVISDVHGQFGNYIKMLQANGIIDSRQNWKFGKGHFVFLGDALDRGDMVTEILWHLISLEKQAAKAGGKVHFLLGNHELMVLDGDLRYISQKYRDVEAISGKTYSELFSSNSVLGRWLRTKPMMVAINDILFVHAGISPELTRRNMTIKEINQIFTDSITGRNTWSAPENEKLDFLAGDKGPAWYRGYFTDSSFSESSLDSTLMFYEKSKVIVGHSTHKEIKSLFNSKVLGIDAGIGYDQPGEMLICKKGVFYKGTSGGKRVKL